MTLADRVMANPLISRLTLSFGKLPSYLEINNLWICGIYSVFLTLAFYPGIFYWDVIMQFNWIEDICNALRAHTLHLPPDIEDQWPIWNVFLRIPFFLLTHEFGIFILLSAFFFFYSVLEIHRSIGQAKTFIITASIFVFTPVSAWMVLHGPHIFVTACVFCFVACQIGGRYWRAPIFVAGATLVRPEMGLIFFLCAIVLLLCKQFSFYFALIYMVFLFMVKYLVLVFFYKGLVFLLSYFSSK